MFFTFLLLPDARYVGCGMTEQRSGLISVIMGIYNCADTLAQAIDSIISQTYTNWELIMCDDGSADNTYQVAETYRNKYPEKIILLKNDQNIGLNKTLNHCLQNAKGEYIARMDGDDTCDPTRFEKQIDFLNKHPEYAICGTPMKFFDENGFWGENHVPKNPSAAQVVSGTPICHATTMIRKTAMDAVNGYTEDDRMLRVEDVNLWIKMYTKGFKAYNLQEPLYHMRNDKNAITRRKYKYRINSTYVRLKGCRELHLGADSYIKAFKPMVYGLVPGSVRHFIRQRSSKSR